MLAAGKIWDKDIAKERRSQKDEEALMVLRTIYIYRKIHSLRFASVVRAEPRRNDVRAVRSSAESHPCTHKPTVGYSNRLKKYSNI